MSTLKFSKMHGAGNDFMVVNGIKTGFVPNKTQLKQWSERNFGVGFDQFLLVETSDKPKVDFKYRIFNADGSEVAQCGNGARCFARFLLDNRLTQQKNIIVETLAGQMSLEMLEDNQVKVNMGVPDFSPKNIPLRQETEQALYQLDINDNEYEFMAVSIGNPHAVLTVEDVIHYPVQTIGKIIEAHALFPDRVNVGFMQILDKENVNLRVYERGVGETLACGSGACAAVVCGVNAGILSGKVKIMLFGGDLLIEWKGKGQPVYMTGPATNVYQGEIEV